ncbi:sensor histidine kinase [Microcella sp.]|uniref:sensor histidine kinase n=1 Tax=Microcella sp. TaxID=1913979 RepID=UPI00391D39F4
MTTTPTNPVSPAGPALPDMKAPLAPLSRRRVDTILSRAVAGFGIVFGAQAIPAMLAQYGFAEPVWAATAIPLVYAALVFSLICALARRFVVGAARVVAFVYVVALVTWPMFVADVENVQSGDHWLYQLTTVATAAAAIGFRTRIATAYLVIVPLMYGVIRAFPQGGTGPAELGFFNAVYAIILGAAVLVIVTMLRVAASNVDAAQQTALQRYARAVRQHATEAERVQVDAIVHDSVLTTLLTAARASSEQEQLLAGRMAADAIRHLEDAALVTPDDGSTVRFRQLADRIGQAARTMPVPFSTRLRSLDARVIPAGTAESLYSAAVQAMVNSAQHAGGPEVRRWLHISGLHTGVIEIVVGDSGVGFELAEVPQERLGVRRSIIERTASGGGEVAVASVPGKGTVVTLRWPAVEMPEPGEAEGESEPGDDA